MARKRDTSAPPVGRCKAELYSRGVSNITDSGVFKNYLGYRAVRVLEGDRYGEPYRFLCWRPKGSDRIYIKQLKIEMGGLISDKRENPVGATGVAGLIIVGLLGYFIGQRSISTMRNISLNRRY